MNLIVLLENEIVNVNLLYDLGKTQVNADHYQLIDNFRQICSEFPLPKLTSRNILVTEFLFTSIASFYFCQPISKLCSTTSGPFKATEEEKWLCQTFLVNRYPFGQDFIFFALQICRKCFLIKSLQGRNCFSFDYRIERIFRGYFLLAFSTSKFQIFEAKRNVVLFGSAFHLG